MAVTKYKYLSFVILLVCLLIGTFSSNILSWSWYFYKRSLQGDTSFTIDGHKFMLPENWLEFGTEKQVHYRSILKLYNTSMFSSRLQMFLVTYHCYLPVDWRRNTEVTWDKIRYTRLSESISTTVEGLSIVSFVDHQASLESEERYFHAGVIDRTPFVILSQSIDASTDHLKEFVDYQARGKTQFALAADCPVSDAG